MKSRQQITIEAVANRDRVLAHVRKMRELLGRGSLMELDERIGKSRGHMARVLRGKAELSIDELFRLMAAFERQPPEFMAGALGVDLEVYLRGLERETPRQVKLLKVALAETEPPDTLPTIKELKELWARDFDATEKACMGVLAANGVEPALEAEAWGLLATVLRRRLLFSSAACCLLRAYAHCKTSRLVRVEADTLRRASFLAADRADLSEASAFADKARDKYLDVGDLQGLATALISGAIFMKRRSQLSEAISRYKLSLKFLSAEDWYQLFSVYQNLGLAYVESGDLEGANLCLSKCREIQDQCDVGIALRAHYQWLKGEVNLAQGRLERSLENFRLIKNFISVQDNPMQIAFVALREAKVLLLMGRLSELRTLVSETASLLRNVRHNRLSYAVLSRLIRAGAAGELTVALIDSLHKRLEVQSQQQ